MKQKLLCLVAIVFLLSKTQAQNWEKKMQNPRATFQEIQNEFNKQWKNKKYVKGNGYKQFKRWEYIMQSRLDENGQMPAIDFLINAKKEYNSKLTQYKTTAVGDWSLIEPTNVTELNGGVGRIQCVVVDPNNTNILWAGTPAGGLWKSIDYGQNWTTNTDELDSMGVSSIVIDPTNSNIMYISTGDPDSSGSKGLGVFKSTDGGQTWNTTSLSYSFIGAKKIHKLIIHPNNSQTLFACGAGGIWKTSDAGTTWNNVKSEGRVYDLEFHPTNVNIIYAAAQGKVHKSENNGSTWNQLNNNLPNDITRIELAVTEAAPNNLYVLYGTNKLYTSTDQGQNFEATNSSLSLGSQAWYDLCINVSPTDSNEIFVGGVSLFKSTNGGVNFSTSGAAKQQGNPWIHADHHNLFWIGNDLYSCNDGGLYRSDNHGENWSLLGNGMNIMQFYRLSSYKYDVNYLTGGAQDNGTSRLKNGVWKKIYGADGMNTIISYDNPDVVYTSTQNGGNISKSTNGGENLISIKGNINETGAWVTPYIIDNTNPNTLYAGYKNVWKSTEGGTNWTKISEFPETMYIHELVQSESSLETLWISQHSKVRKTTNGGTTWEEINNLPTTQIKSIAIDPTNSERVWMSSLGTQNGKKVYKTENGGQTWLNISGSLPNIPVNQIVYQKGSNDALYIATDLGVFFRDASMNDWVPFNNNLPNIRVDDIEINYSAEKIIAATYGRGMWSSDLHPTISDPTADFTNTLTSGCTGLTVQFTNHSSNATSISWSFPGGTPSTSTNENPVVTYTNGGMHDVSLTVSNADGSDTFTKSNLIDISGGMISSFPYTENFDGFTVGDPGTMQNGWMNTTNDEGDWFVHTGIAPIRNQSKPYEAGPNTDHTTGGGNYMLVEASEIGQGRTAVLLTPCFDLTGITNPKLEYYQHVYGYNDNFSFDLDIFVDDLWVESLTPSITSPIGDQWIKREVDLTAYSGKIIRFKFKALCGNTQLDWAIDDFKISNVIPTTPVAEFSASTRYGLPNLEVSFTDESENFATSWSWSFPGGTPSTSTTQHPVVNYVNEGVYPVTLTATNAIGSHTETKTDYIVISDNEYNMSNQTVINCNGTLYDSGGENGDYQNNENLVFTIAPQGAINLRLTLSSWDAPSGGIIAFKQQAASLNTLSSDTDVLNIYRGSDTSGELIRSFSGSQSMILPFTSDSGTITIEFLSDQSSTAGGWKLLWESIEGNCNEIVETPIANFNASNTSINQGDSVTFTDISTNYPTSWSWSFEGGTSVTSTDQNTTVTYNTAGTYTVTLTASNSAGNGTVTKTDYITVNEVAPEYNMSSQTVTECSGTLYDAGGANGAYSNNEDLTFTIAPTGADSVTIDFSSWDVENNYDNLKIYNGTSASANQLGLWSGTNPGSVTANSGAMTLVFASDSSVTGTGWSANWTCGKNTNPPITEFNASNTNVSEGDTVIFTDATTNNPTSWSWSFEGGNPATSISQNPTVTYASAGAYAVTLTTTNTYGNDVETKTNYITVTEPSTEYNMSNQTVTECSGTLYDAGGTNGNYLDNENYTFVINPTSADYVTIDFSTWDVEQGYDYLKIYNGTSASATLLGSWSGTNPGTVTANSGAITLVFTSDGGVTGAGWSAAWTCGQNTNPPVTDFNTSNTNVSEGDTVTFTDATSNNPTSWSWSFEGGNPATSTSQNPSVSYATAGIYPVTLTTTNTYGSDVETKTGYITVTEASTEYNMSNQTVTECSGSLYDAGGTNGNYSNNENYTFIINPQGADYVTIDFSTWDVENNYDYLKIYNGTSASASQLGSWSGTNPGTVTANSGAMTIVFNSDSGVIGAGWSAAWTCGQNTNPPVTDFNASNTNVSEGDTVTFTDATSNNPTSWSWSFEGGNPAISTSQNPSVYYAAAGTYAVTLTATNAYGTDIETKTNYITVTEASTEYNMSNQTVTQCSGTLYDTGGINGNYSNNEDLTFTIAPSGATSVTITVNSWEVENNYDFLKVFDGTSTSGTQLGSWSGTNPGTITANSGAITLNFKSDNIISKSGWDITWTSTGGNCTSNSRINSIPKTENHSEIKVYPIPVEKTVTVELEFVPKHKFSIVVLDNLGREMKRITSQEKKSKINMSGLNSGVYYLRVIVDNDVITKRITKK